MHSAAVGKRQLPAIYFQLRMKFQVERVVQFNFHLLFSGKAVIVSIFRSQVPFFHKGIHFPGLYAHTEIEHKPFAAGLDGREQPVAAGPLERFSDSKLCAGLILTLGTPEVSVKIDLPFRPALAARGSG